MFGLAGVGLALVASAISAEADRRERLRASFREQAALHGREASYLDERAAEAASAAEALRRIAGRGRLDAESCEREADEATWGFSRELWLERAGEFRSEAERVEAEAESLDRRAAGRRDEARRRRTAWGRYLALAAGSDPELAP